MSHELIRIERHVSWWWQCRLPGCGSRFQPATSEGDIATAVADHLGRVHGVYPISTVREVA